MKSVRWNALEIEVQRDEDEEEKMESSERNQFL
jgi:hypothetical protein